MKEIRITCTGSDYISHKDLLPLQGNWEYAVPKILRNASEVKQ